MPRVFLRSYGRVMMGRKWGSSVPWGHVGVGNVGFGLLLAIVSIGVGAGFNFGLASFTAGSKVPSAAVITTDQSSSHASKKSIVSTEVQSSSESELTEPNARAGSEGPDKRANSSGILQIAPSSPVDQIPNVGVVEPGDATNNQTPPSQGQVFFGEGSASKSPTGQMSGDESTKSPVQATVETPTVTSQGTITQPKAISQSPVDEVTATSNHGDG